jgi:hypothetical protein
MRSFAFVLTAICSAEAFAHASHGALLAHLHQSDGYLLAGLAFAVAGAWSAWKLK